MGTRGWESCRWQALGLSPSTNHTLVWLVLFYLLLLVFYSIINSDAGCNSAQSHYSGGNPLMASDITITERVSNTVGFETLHRRKHIYRIKFSLQDRNASFSELSKTFSPRRKELEAFFMIHSKVRINLAVEEFTEKSGNNYSFVIQVSIMLQHSVYDQLQELVQGW